MVSKRPAWQTGDGAAGAAGAATDWDAVRKTESAPPKVYYGWWIVLFSAATAFFSGPGQTYSIGFFADEYTREFSWSRSQTSGMFAIATVVSGCTMTAVGGVIDHLGSKRAAWMTGTALGGACFLNSLVNGQTTVMMGFFAVRFFGQGERE